MKVISDKIHIKYTATERLNVVLFVSKISTSSGREFATVVTRGKYEISRVFSRLFLEVQKRETLSDNLGTGKKKNANSSPGQTNGGQVMIKENLHEAKCASDIL